ncbi:elongation factor 4 [candidate division KSB1 bacterium]|nr:MAG: elongation factor 4 [candidate division KSB1 bacterium]
MYKENIRNFCIIAHIDHGKSTLADRLLEKTKTVSPESMMNQVLDDMDLERERGITIKAHAIMMHYKHKDNKKYTLNLIDTPGHVDFSYEVSRSLVACEGALLVVDAAQGIEAQTVSNIYLAMENDLTIIPVINKIDLPSAQIDRTRNEIVELLGCEEEDILLISAKQGTGIDSVLDAIVNKIPPPAGETDSAPRALIFDSVFDFYRGAIAYVRMIDGTIRQGDKIIFMSTGREFEIDEIGVLRLRRQKKECLKSGEVGYIIAGVKNLKDTKVGDTITLSDNPASTPLPGFKEPKPMVFSGLFPTDSDDLEELRNALDRLKLNDSALSIMPESSAALGFGFRVGFLGLLHMEIIQERLEREYKQNLITTMPNVEVIVIKKTGETVIIDNPAKLPKVHEIDHIEEPFVDANIITPSEYVGNLMKLAQDRRGEYKNTSYIDESRANLYYRFPLSEIIFDFYDKLKSLSRGYASFDYEIIGFEKSDLVKLDLLINGEPVDALSMIVHRSKAYEWGQKLTIKLKELIPRQLFEVAIQAAIGSKVISRTTVKALRKNVTAKCYGGDITRKRKLLEKQRQGKKRMKMVGKIEIPQEAFLALLQIK